MPDKISVIARSLGAASSPVRGATHARVLRAVAQQRGRGIRREIATELEVSAGTVSKAVAQQMALQLVEEEDVRLKLLTGRPLVPLKMTKRFAMVGIAVVAREGVPDELVGSIVFLDGTMPSGFERSRRQALTAAAQGSPRILGETLVKFAWEFTSARLKDVEVAGERTPVEILGCGITIAGHVRDDVIEMSPITLWKSDGDWSGVRDTVSEQLGLPVSIDNDVTGLAVRNNLRPLGEEPYEHYAMLAAIDSGVGGAVVYNTRTWPGAFGAAGEAGHLKVRGIAAIDELPDEPGVAVALGTDEPPCPCGGTSHVDAFASVVAIEKRAHWAGVVTDRCSIGELAARPRSDRRLAMLFHQGGLALGTAITSNINWFDPQRIIVYLPPELNETNPYLAGHYYRKAVRSEIEDNPIAPDAWSRVELRTIPQEDMKELLAQAAAYLVFRRLIRAVAAETAPR